MAKWTDNLQGLDDKQLADSLKRIHKTVSKMHKTSEHHTKPYQWGKVKRTDTKFSKAPTKGPSQLRQKVFSIEALLCVKSDIRVI